MGEPAHPQETMAMRVFGVDFTSTPCARKPLTCALATLSDDRVFLHALCAFESLDCFANLLASDGPWVAGMDFPFGLPRDFLRPLKWSTTWARYVGTAAEMPRAAFQDLVCSLDPDGTSGERYALRETDRATGARCRARAARSPVCLRFHTGAPRLLASGVTVVPVHEGDPSRTVIEACPNLVAQALIGRQPYNADQASVAGASWSEGRADLVSALASERVGEIYGVAVVGLAAFESELCRDARGGAVNALMCAVQAAWAWNHREQGFGVPADVDRTEGWIVDPATAEHI